MEKTRDETPPNEESTGRSGLGASARTVAKNASYLMTSQLITWVLAIGLTLLLPRYLGPEGIGQIHLAQSLWAIAAVFISFGMNTLIVKQIARNPEQGSVLFGQSVILRIILYLVSWLILAGYVWLAGYQATTVAVIGIIGASSLSTVIGGAARATLSGIEQMQHISVADVLSKSVSLVATILVLILGGRVLAVAGVAILTTIVSTLYILFQLRRTFPLTFRINFRSSIRMLRAGTSYLSADVARVFYQQVDVVVISLLVNEVTIGWYSAADRLFSTLLFIPAVFITAVFPLMSRLHEQSPERLRELFQRSLGLLLVVSFPLGVGLMIVADNVAVLLFGADFAQTGPPLALFGIVLILTYQNILLGKFAQAVDRQKLWAAIIALATIATIPLDLLLIPWTNAQFGNGAMGGVLAFVITEGGMFVVGMYLLARERINRNFFIHVAKVVTAGALMAAVVWPLRDAFIAIPIVAGAVVYIALILLMRAVPPEDRELLVGAAGHLRAKLGRLRRRGAKSAQAQEA